MAKAKTKSDKVAASFDALKPYIERALTDDDFRNNVRTALAAAGAVYGDVAKGNGVSAASKLASDKKAQENLRKAYEELNEAGYRLKGGKKKSKKKRNTALLIGFIVGVFYNPWTGPQTRQWLLDRIAGGDDLQPLESWDTGETAASFEEAADAASDDGGS